MCFKLCLHHTNFSYKSPISSKEETQSNSYTTCNDTSLAKNWPNPTKTKRSEANKRHSLTIPASCKPHLALNILNTKQNVSLAY